MPRELHIQDGKVSMMYVDEEPWHSIGTELSAPLTAAEAIRDANLDWEVDKKPLYVGEGGKYRLPNRHAVVRKDLWGKKYCPVLGIVGKDYAPLQNKEAFKFFDPIAGKGAATYEMAGAIGDGKRIWILAKLASDIHVIGDDITKKYLLLSNSHDGTSSIQIKLTPIRIFCSNMLTMALRQGPTLRIVHTKDMHQRLKNAERALELINKRFEKIEKTFQRMTRVQVRNGRLTEYLNLVFPDPQDLENERVMVRAKQDRAWAEYFFDQGKGNQIKGVAGTLWAAYNGVAELIDHRQTKQTPDRRLNSLWFGEGYATKARAFTVAEEKMMAWRNQER